jgi:dolichyl-phosphate-mannose--protein O-mannosyl transferase
MIAGGIEVLGDRALGWRFASAVCGSATLVAIFFWAYLLLGDFPLALLAAILTLFNNFLFVMARTAMLDSVYFAFVMLGVLAFTASFVCDVSTRAKRVLMLWSGLMFGAGMACKWNAVVFLGCVVLISGYLFRYDRSKVLKIGVPVLLLALFAIPFGAYYLTFVGTSLWTHSSPSFREFIAANQFMWHWHRIVPGNPTLNVRWYRWFFRASPERGLAYLMGNWVVAWTGVLAILLCIWGLWKKPAESLPELSVVLLYGTNVLQWLVIPQKSTCYYYYYPSMMVLGVAVAIVLSRSTVRQILGLRVSVVLIAASFVFFLYCYPRMAALQAPYDCALGCWP